MKYFVNTPWWIKKLYSAYTWEIKTGRKNIYLTFDDGPHPIATPFVLDQLKKYNARATFFCRGSNVLQYPAIYKRIMDEGHGVGNHSHTHPNGWKTNDEYYLTDINTASNYIQSSLFRPPYGRITKKQAKKLKTSSGDPYKIIMWSILSGDFDTTISKQKCLENVVNHVRPGAIVVFHDSEKAFPRLAYTLPLVLKFLTENEYSFKSLDKEV